MIHFACPGCQKAYKVPNEVAGRKTTCRHCGKPLQVPERVLALPETPVKPGASGSSAAEEFRRRRTRQIAVIPIAAVAILVGMLSTTGIGEKLWRMIGVSPLVALGGMVVVVLAVATFSYMNWRCPSCGSYLGPVLNVPACRKCGTAFQSDQTAQTTRAVAGDPTIQGIAGWLLIPAGALLALPFIVGSWWVRHYLLIADLKQRGFSYDPYVAGHYHVAAIDGVGGALLLMAAAFVGFIFFRKHRSTPLLYIACLVLGLVFSVVRFGMMWSLIGTEIAASRYEFYEFRQGSSARLLLASHLVAAMVACLIGIPYFLRSKRVQATFVRGEPLARRTKLCALGALGAGGLVLMIVLGMAWLSVRGTARPTEGVADQKVSVPAVMRDGRPDMVPPPDQNPRLPAEEPKGEHEVFRLRGHDAAPGRIVISPDATLVLSQDGFSIWVWDLRLGKKVTSWDGHGPLAISPDGKRTLSGHGSKIVIRDITTGTSVRELDTKRFGSHAGAFSPDGEKILVDCQFWEVQAAKMLHHWDGQYNTLKDIAFMADGQRLFLIHEYGGIMPWNVAEGKFVKFLKTSTEQGYTHLRLAPKERHLFAYGRRGGTVSVFDLQTGTEQIFFSEPKVHDGCFSGNGERIVLGYEDGRVRLFETRTGKVLQEVGRHTDGVTCVGVSRDGRLAVTGGTDQTVRVWKLTD